MILQCLGILVSIFGAIFFVLGVYGAYKTITEKKEVKLVVGYPLNHILFVMIGILLIIDGIAVMLLNT